MTISLNISELNEKLTIDREYGKRCPVQQGGKKEGDRQCHLLRLADLCDSREGQQSSEKCH